MKRIFYWVEIPTEDFDRAVDFYSKLLKVELEKLDFETEKMACLPHDAGAIIWAPDFKPSKDGVIVSLNCGNEIDEWLKLIVEYGGKSLVRKQKLKPKDAVGLLCSPIPKAINWGFTENKSFNIQPGRFNMIGLELCVFLYLCQ